MFFSVYLWATVVIQSMTQISGQSGWFKTERPNPPIVSYAKDTGEIPANKVAGFYAETLANHRYDGHDIFMQNSTLASFFVGKAHEYIATNGEAGVIVHNTHKQTGISYITFLVGDWAELQKKLDAILLQYHTQYQSVFPTAPTLISSAHVAAAASSGSVQFSLPMKGVDMPITGFCEIPLDKIVSGWDEFDRNLRRDIMREVLFHWHRVWQEEEKHKPALCRLLQQFVSSLPRERVESESCEDQQNSLFDFMASYIHEFDVNSLDRYPIALPMFLMQYWDSLQPPKEEEGQRQRCHRRQEDLQARLIVLILINSQRSDLKPLKGYFEPLLPQARLRISDLKLDDLLEVFGQYTSSVVGKPQFAVNRVYVSALQKSFMNLLEVCESRMDERSWEHASYIAGMQANLLFFQKYKESQLDVSNFEGRVPLFLAPDVWHVLRKQTRQDLFLQAARSDENLVLVKRYMSDHAIDNHVKNWAYHAASEQISSVAARASSQKKLRAPKIAELLESWKQIANGNADDMVGGLF